MSLVEQEHSQREHGLERMADWVRFYVTGDAVGVGARLLSRFSIPCRRWSGPFWMVASAKLSELLEESETQTTGMREPEARIRKVNLSRLSEGRE